MPVRSPYTNGRPVSVHRDADRNEPLNCRTRGDCIRARREWETSFGRWKVSQLSLNTETYTHRSAHPVTMYLDPEWIMLPL